MDPYYLNVKDAEGNRLRVGDRVLVCEPSMKYYGRIEQNIDFATPMLRVTEREYSGGQWQKVGAHVTMWVPIMQKKRTLFTRRLRGVYMMERYVQDADGLSYATLPLI